MQDILIATTNSNKVERIKRLLDLTKINILSLKDLDYQIEPPEETGSDGVENAIIKAKYYYGKLKNKITVLTQDETLFISEVSKEDNPKKDIKLPVIKKYGQFTDENAYNYYSNLVKKYNKEYLDFEFRYGYAICGENFLEGSSSVLPGRLYSQLNSKRTPGYFLADMMKVKIGNEWKYSSDLNEYELISIDSASQEIIKGLIEKLKPFLFN